MKNQLGVITAKIDDLPSTLAKYLSNVGTTPTTLPAAPAAPANPHLFSSGPTIEPPPQLNRKDFPHVKHWTPRYFTSLRKGVKEEENEGSLDTHGATSAGSSKRSGKKESTSSCFMEDENGEPIPEHTRSAARSKAKGFWIEIFAKGIAPATYGKAGIDMRNQYISLMENTFPWLRYCENHWKADQIWRNGYPDWYSRALIEQEKEKEKAAKEKAAKEKVAMEGEVIDVDADVGDSQDNKEGSSKRPRVDDETNSEPKRRRVEEDQATPPSRPVPTKITPKRLRVRSILYITICFTNSV